MSKSSLLISQYGFYVIFSETEAGGKTPESLTPILRDKSVHAVGWSFALQCLSNLFLSHKTIHLNVRIWIPPGHKKGGKPYWNYRLEISIEDKHPCVGIPTIIEGQTYGKDVDLNCCQERR